MDNKEKVFLPQLIGLVVLVITQIIYRFLWEMPNYIYIPIASASLISMAVGVAINFKRK